MADIGCHAIVPSLLSRLFFYYLLGKATWRLLKQYSFPLSALIKQDFYCLSSNLMDKKCILI